MFDNIICKDHPNEFFQLPSETQKYVLSVIGEYFSPIKSINKSISSYELKHLLQNDKFGNLYLTNGQFKGAMLVAGFNADDTSELNWHFNLSKKSVTELKKSIGH